MEQVTIFNHQFLSKPSKAFNTSLKRSSRLPQDKIRNSNPGRVPNHPNYFNTSSFHFTYVTVCSMPRTERNPCPKEFTGQVPDNRGLTRLTVGTIH